MGVGRIISGKQRHGVLQIALFRLIGSHVTPGSFPGPLSGYLRISLQGRSIAKDQAFQCEALLVQLHRHGMFALGQVKIYRLSAVPAGAHQRFPFPIELFHHGRTKIVADHVLMEGVVIHPEISLIQERPVEIHILSAGKRHFPVQRDCHNDVVVLTGDGAVIQRQLIIAFLLCPELPGDAAALLLPVQCGFPSVLREIGVGIHAFITGCRNLNGPGGRIFRSGLTVFCQVGRICFCQQGLHGFLRALRIRLRSPHRHPGAHTSEQQYTRQNSGYPFRNFHTDPSRCRCVIVYSHYSTRLAAPCQSD